MAVMPQWLGTFNQPRPDAPLKPVTNYGQAIGDALQGGAQIVQNQQDILQKMLAARVANIQAEQQAMMLQKDDERKAAEEKRKADEEKRHLDFLAKVNKGKEVSPALAKDSSLASRSPADGLPSAQDFAQLELGGTSGMPSQQVSGMDSTRLMGDALNRPENAGSMAGGVTPYTRDEIPELALKSGTMDTKGYMDATDPTKTLEGQKALIEARADAKEGDRAFRWALNEYNQGRMDRRTLMQINAALDRAEMNERNKPRTQSGMPLKPLASEQQTKMLKLFGAARDLKKIDELYNALPDAIKGPAMGRISKNNPYYSQVQAFMRTAKSAIPNLARGPFAEVGVLTDQDVAFYQSLLADMTDTPGTVAQVMDELKTKLADEYKNSYGVFSMSGNDMTQFNPDWTFDELANASKGVQRQEISDRSGGGNKPAPPRDFSTLTEADIDTMSAEELKQFLGQQ